MMSRNNIELDETLVKEAMRLTDKKTKMEIVNYALEELVRMRKIKKLLELEGKVKWSGDLDDTRMSRT